MSSLLLQVINEFKADQLKASQLMSEKLLCSKELLLPVSDGLKADPSNTSRLIALQWNKNLTNDCQIFSLLESQLLYHITTTGLHESSFDVNMKAIHLYLPGKDFMISCAGMYQTTRKRPLSNDSTICV